MTSKNRNPGACLAIAIFLVNLAISEQSQAVETAEAAIDPVEIVTKADRIRFPAEGYQVDVHITSSAPERDDDIREYRILSNGIENTVVLSTAPASDRGQIVLMKGRDLWVFLPSVSQPVRLPLSQRLTGQVSNGDLARANFQGDYTPELLKTEEIEGQSHYVLELTAVGSGVTYAKVMYWVNRANFRPYKAEFHTLSGRLFKTARYLNFNPMAGESRPTRLVLEDALKAGEKSVLDYRDMKIREIPDKVFTKDYLKKLE